MADPKVCKPEVSAKMERSLSTWEGLDPLAVVEGSRAQLTIALADARKDILTMARVIAALRDFVIDEWAVRIDSHTLGGRRETLNDDGGPLVSEAEHCLALIECILPSPPKTKEPTQ